MHSIQYVLLEKKDYHAVGEILNQAFNLSSYVLDKKTLVAFKMQYVYSCLSEATYICVAKQNNKVIGIIMGNAKNDYHLLSHLPYFIATAWYTIKMSYYSRRDKTGIRDFHRLHQIYHDFSKKHQNEFDGVLTLFAIDKNYRNLGVGKELLNRLLKYLKEKNVNNIYLYTDTTCNYGFYEHLNFIRLEQQPLILTKNNQPFKMNVFLYGYSISKES